MSPLAASRGPYRNGIERRQSIVEAASAAFARRGYSGASLREIAETVGVTPAAILRHFGSKEGLLIAVLDRWAERTAALDQRVTGGRGSEVFRGWRGLMQYHVEHPGLIELFLTLCTEASDPTHPARAWVADRYASIVADAVENLRLAAEAGEARRMPRAEREFEVRALFAAMDGIELQWIVDPTLDLVGLFNDIYAETLSRWGMDDGGLESPCFMPAHGDRVASHETAAGSTDDEPARVRYRNGAERHEQIVTAASELFAERGFVGASLREIAERVGVTAAALLRHFRSKNELLFAVLERWDRDNTSFQGGERPMGLDYFAMLEQVMRHHPERPGLVELFLTLCTEASDPAHPARHWVVDRYRNAIANACDAFREAQQRGDIQPMSPARREFEARWLFAVMDGLELQWIADPALDPGELFHPIYRAALERWKRADIADDDARGAVLTDSEA